MPSQNAKTTEHTPTKKILLLGFILINFARWAVPGRVQAAEQNSVSIMVPKTEDVVLQFAAQDLERYLKRVTGEPIGIGKAGVPHHIYLGAVPASAPAGEAKRLHAEVEKLQEDGFVIRSLGPDVVIAGKGSRGNLYGCYAFLERQGVRWFFPGEQYEVVPHHALDWKAPLDLSESPAFRDRILFFDGVNYTSLKDWIDFAAKARLNRIAFFDYWPMRNWYIDQRSQLLPECRKRGFMLELGSHLLASFLPRTLFKEHPGWFRLNEKGERTNDFNLNPFNPEALDYVSSNALHYFTQMPEASLFHCWPDDLMGGGWTHEQGKDEYTSSDQSLLVANYLVSRLRKNLPNAQLAYLAYHDTTLPPHIVKPDPGVVLLNAPRERCYAHSLDDAQCLLNRKYKEVFELLLPVFGAPKTEAFEYYVDEILFQNMTDPPLPDVISADAQYYYRLGIPSLGALAVNLSEYVTPAVNMFLYPQALWNPPRDLKRSLDEYAIRYFGDAELGEYFRELTQGLQDVLKTCKYEQPGDEWYSLRPDQETEEGLAYHVQGLEEGLRGPLTRASYLLERAMRHAQSEQYRARLERERVSMGYTLLQARLYYHLLKGEWFYRNHKSHHDMEAGLGVASESVLATYTYEKLQKFVGRWGVRGEPIMPGPGVLEGRMHELQEEGYATYQMTHRLRKGVNGYLVDSPFGSRAVVWTDVVGSAPTMQAGVSGLEWRDEFGQVYGARALNLSTSPAVIEGRGLSTIPLFDALVASQEEADHQR
jgi:hypothetical protein